MAHEPALKQLGVQRLYLFGSMLAGAAYETSDADLFFDDERGRSVLMRLMDVQARVTDILGRPSGITFKIIFIANPKYCWLVG